MKFTLRRARRVGRGVNAINKKFKYLSRVRAIASVMLLTVAMPTNITPAAELDEQKTKASDYNITLETNSALPLVSNESISQITPGESKTERENREKAETEAKNRAIALAEQAKQSRDSVSRESRPGNFDEVYRRAEETFGVDARLLKAIHYVETGLSGSTSKGSYAGAIGPMQFLPSTFRKVGVDGNGDGRAEITDVQDSIYSAAKYLKLCGYPDVKKALWGYNPSSSYYRKVTKVASSLGYNQ